MKWQVLLTLLIAFPFLTESSRADVIDRQVIDFADDAEEDITGPDAGNVRRTSSDLEIGNENGILQWVGVRIQEVDVPAGSTINSAMLRFTGTETDVGSLIIPIFGELSIDPEPFADETPLTTRTLTSNSVIWDIDPWFPGDNGINTTTTDLTPILQEIIDQPGWSGGRSVVFLIQNDPLDTSERLAVSFDGNPAQAPVLTVDFTPGKTILLGDVNLDGVVNLLDVSPFVDVISTSGFQLEADVNQDGVVNLLDVAVFIDILSGN